MRRRPSLKQIAQSAALHEETAKMSVFFHFSIKFAQKCPCFAISKHKICKNLNFFAKSLVNNSFLCYNV
jgi:hypothetical protein